MTLFGSRTFSHSAKPNFLETNMESRLTSEVKVSGGSAVMERNKPPGFSGTGEAGHRKLYRNRGLVPADRSAGEHGFSQQQNRSLMDPSQPGPLYLRSTSTVSLNERFSQVLQSQLTRPNKPIIRTSEPVSLHPRSRLKRVVLPLSQRMKLRPRKRRRSVWTRLGGLQLTRHLSYCSLPGFWSFRNKYTLRARRSATYRRRGKLDGCLGQSRLVRTAKLQTQTAGGQRLSQTLQRGGATSLKGRWFPTRKQLDAQLDEYMSLSRSRLDKQLEDYMSMSRRRLDEELDEYMMMAGQSLED
ncbi:uncharacterized protein LOC124865540 [Girardinichthys multiradiatus]|uniref:uncharacterized protein LOC124865540 n=1 Tax=Girardinichthys multiradiatus TaxID=208333 RepID=UPI001FAD169D|nr:uncharacterized protein LOC124865540 [Girardinichthys multiradiatus]